jgi:hypothetical protein
MLVHFPQLRSLSAALCIQPIDAPLLFPIQLQHLAIDLASTRTDARQTTSALLTAIGQLQQLHTLRLRMYFGQVSLAPLKQLPLLRDLQINMSFWHAGLFAEGLHALPWLHRLYIDAVAGDTTSANRVSLFTALLRDVPEEQLHALQWRNFAIRRLKFTDELTSLLVRLPLLQCLEADLTRCTRFDFIAALPRLAHLTLHMAAVEGDAWRNLLAVFISDELARLHTLELHGGPYSSDDLVKILSHTPILTGLTLHKLETVSSLSFFLQLPKLAETLAQLTIQCTSSWRLTAADLQPLQMLQQLRELQLLEWSGKEPGRLTAADRAPFEQRPCAVLPRLELFRWTQLVEWDLLFAQASQLSGAASHVRGSP